VNVRRILALAIAGVAAFAVTPAHATTPTEPDRLLASIWLSLHRPAAPERGNADLWIVRPDGSLGPRLMRTPNVDEYPGTWSPDGRRLVYQAVDGDHSEVVIARRDGSVRRRLTDSKADNFCPAWSGDGRWIAWMHEPRRGPDELRMARPNGEARQIVPTPTSDPRPSCPVWSPDGRFLTLAAIPDGEDDFEIYMLNIRSGEWDRMTRTDANEYPADWLPGGHRILVPLWRTFNGPERVFTMWPDGSHRRRLLADAGPAHITSSGRWIFFTHLTPHSGWTGLYRAPIDGGDPKRVVPVDGHIRI